VQAEGLDKAGVKVEHVVEISVDDDEIVRRMSGRRIHPGSGRSYHLEFNPPKIAGQDDITGEALIQRDDDAESTVRERLRVYHEQTKPLVGFYKRASASGDAMTFSSIDGKGSVDEITARIMEVLK
jgi:adenylate kinase